LSYEARFGRQKIQQLLVKQKSCSHVGNRSFLVSMTSFSISTYTAPREANLKAIHEDLVWVRGRVDDGDTVQL
jgi:hypothetical protein